MNEEKFQAWLIRLGKPESKALSANYYGDPANAVKFKRKEADMTDNELHNYVEDWLRWCYTRKYFIPPGAKNILARMQPQKVGRPPDARMSEELSWFNMALHALADMEEHKSDLECFNLFYVERVKNIKAVADKLNIGTRTFYDRRSRFSRNAIKMAASLKKAYLTAKDAAMIEVEDAD